MTDSPAFDHFIMVHFPTARAHVGQHGQAELIMDCPRCGAKQRCCLNPTKRKFNCYRCGGGNLIEWLMTECGLSHGDAYKLTKDVAPDNLDDFSGIVEGFMSPTPPPPKIPGEGIAPFVRDFVRIGESVVANLVCEDWLLKKRGFTLGYAAQWRLMYAGSGKYQDRLILPVFENGVVTYFQGRSMTGAEPKYLNPGVMEGCSGKHFVFNLDAVAATKPPVVCVMEGGFNAMSAGAASVALFGKHMSPEQAMKLQAALPQGTHLVFCFDHGAEEEAYDAAMSVSGWFHVSVLVMPDKRDLNDWFKEAGYQAVAWLLEHNVMSPSAAYELALNTGRLKQRKR